MSNEREEQAQQILAQIRIRPADLELHFRQLHDLFVSTVHHFFSKRGISPEDCFDLTQETFVGIYKGIASFRGESRFDTWLFKVATNVYRLHLRRSHTKKRAGQELALTPPEGEDLPGLGDLLEHPDPLPDEEIVRRERSDKLRAAIAEMPAKMQRCVRLKIYQGLSTREIGAVLRISEETVKAHFHQAKLRLRQRLAE